MLNQNGYQSFRLYLQLTQKTIGEMDEFWQKVIESLSGRSHLTAIISLGLGMLQLLGYVPRVSLFVFPYMISMLGLSLLFLLQNTS